MTDVIVVGSGASAVHATWPLLDAGLKVLMLDVGNSDSVYAPLIPDRPFSAIRRTDGAQHRYLLGDEFEGIPFGDVRVGAQLTPPRAFITRDTTQLTPVDGPGFFGMESLGAGGLAAGWGAGVTRFSAFDLARTPLTPVDLEPHYRAVEERIGVSGECDDLSKDLGDHVPMMPPLRLDSSARRILDRYCRRRDDFHRRGLRLGITRLAACSRAHRGRGAHRYDDLDFWADKDRAVYRAQWTLDELRQRPGFTYLPDRLALAFEEAGTGVRLSSRVVSLGAAETHESRAILLAAGVFGTTRIVLRSLGQYDRPVPLVTNPYTYVPCLNLGMVGRTPDDARHSLSQLTATYSVPGRDAHQVHVSMYSYRSLLTFKIMKEVPLSAQASLQLMRALIPMLTILGVHHDDTPSARKSLMLRRGVEGAPDRLAVKYELDDDQAARIEHDERAVLAIARSLGLWAIKRVRPGHGSSIHYAGPFPMSDRPGPLQTSRAGLLHGTRSVHIADGSLLPDLPAKGLTLTLMANADRVGTHLARTFG